MRMCECWFLLILRTSALPSYFLVFSNSLKWNHEKPTTTTIGLTQMIWRKMHVYRCAHTTANKLISSPCIYNTRQMDTQIYSLDIYSNDIYGLQNGHLLVCSIIFFFLIFHQRFGRSFSTKKKEKKNWRICVHIYEYIINHIYKLFRSPFHCWFNLTIDIYMYCNV